MNGSVQFGAAAGHSVRSGTPWSAQPNRTEPLASAVYEVVAEDVLPGRDRRVSHYGVVAPAEAGEWAEISVELSSMQPRLFGRPVVDAPLEPSAATSIGLFLADGIDGEFALELDWIDVCRPPERI